MNSRTMLFLVSFILGVSILPRACALPLFHWGDRAIERSFYVRAVPNDPNFRIQGPLPSGQDSALGRIKYDFLRNGNLCWNVETEGIDWDSSSTSALSINKAEDGTIVASLPDAHQQSTRNGLDVLTASGCQHASQLNPDIEELETEWKSLVGEVKAANEPGLSLQGPFIPSEVEVDEPKSFTSHFYSTADGSQVINPDGSPNPGPEGAIATFELRINSDEETVCYEINTFGITGEYFNAARTSTHLGGLSGPSAFPRITFKNPEPVNPFDDGERSSSACVRGPFASGRVEFGVDSGSQSGFTLKKFEEDPSPYFVDIHTFDHAVGIVRGALERIA